MAKAGRPKKAKMTDAERHKRFLAMAHEVEADERPEAFDRAFKKVAHAKPDHGKGMRPRSRA